MKANLVYPNGKPVKDPAKDLVLTGPVPESRLFAAVDLGIAIGFGVFWFAALWLIVSKFVG